MGIMMWERAGQLWSNDKDKRGGVEKAAAAALFAACHRFRLLKEAHQLCVKAAEEEESLAVEQLVLVPPARPAWPRSPFQVSGGRAGIGAFPPCTGGTAAFT